MNGFSALRSSSAARSVGHHDDVPRYRSTSTSGMIPSISKGLFAANEPQSCCREGFQMRDQAGLGVVHEVGDFSSSRSTPVDEATIAGIIPATVQSGS